jgi:predicted GNAT superfamily acetyltransferase
MEDRQSIQIGAMAALLRGEEPGTIAMINGDSVRRYTYTRTKTESVTTRMGTFESVVYESTRTNSNRVSRVWHASALGFVPVRAEQVRKGKVETVMELVALQRGNPAAK